MISDTLYFIFHIYNISSFIFFDFSAPAIYIIYRYIAFAVISYDISPDFSRFSSSSFSPCFIFIFFIIDWWFSYSLLVYIIIIFHYFHWLAVFFHAFVACIFSAAEDMPLFLDIYFRFRFLFISAICWFSMIFTKMIIFSSFLFSILSLIIFSYALLFSLLLSRFHAIFAFRCHVSFIDIIRWCRRHLLIAADDIIFIIFIFDTISWYISFAIIIDYLIRHYAHIAAFITLFYVAIIAFHNIMPLLSFRCCHFAISLIDYFSLVITMFRYFHYAWCWCLSPILMPCWWYATFFAIDVWCRWFSFIIDYALIIFTFFDIYFFLPLLLIILLLRYWLLSFLRLLIIYHYFRLMLIFSFLFIIFTPLLFRFHFLHFLLFLRSFRLFSLFHYFCAHILFARARFYLITLFIIAIFLSFCYFISSPLLHFFIFHYIFYFRFHYFHIFFIFDWFSSSSSDYLYIFFSFSLLLWYFIIFIYWLLISLSFYFIFSLFAD